jgi:hypothetical protein
MVQARKQRANNWMVDWRAGLTDKCSSILKRAENRHTFGTNLCTSLKRLHHKGGILLLEVFGGLAISKANRRLDSGVGRSKKSGWRASSLSLY